MCGSMGEILFRVSMIKIPLDHLKSHLSIAYDIPKDLLIKLSISNRLLCTLISYDLEEGLHTTRVEGGWLVSWLSDDPPSLQALMREC